MRRGSHVVFCANTSQEGEDYTACRGRCFPGCPDIPYEVLTEVPKRPDPDPTPPEPPSPKPPSRAKRPIQRPKVVAIGRKKEQEEALPEVGRTASAFKPPQAQLPKLQLPAFKLPDLWWLPGILGPRMRDFAGMAPGAGGYGGQGVF